MTNQLDLEFGHAGSGCAHERMVVADGAHFCVRCTEYVCIGCDATMGTDVTVYCAVCEDDGTAELYRRVTVGARGIYGLHAAGCCLHIVLDDGNVEDHHVDHCIRYAHKAGHKECWRTARALREMSPRQRARVYERYEEYARG